MVIRDKLPNAFTHLTKSRIISIQEHNYKNYLYLFLIVDSKEIQRLVKTLKELSQT